MKEKNKTKNGKIRYYSSFTDDFEESADQNYELPEDYKWIRRDIKSKILSEIIYGMAVIFGGAYCRLFLHMKIHGRKNIRKIKDGAFIYGNHTQPVGDVFIPAITVLPKRIYTVVSTANYGIPVIGKILPYLGALPIVGSLHGMIELNRAMEERLNGGHPIVIYPEAHVWEYYTEIRPFPETSFKYPVKFNRPAFAMTVTYKKHKHNFFKRPVMEVYLDGPFYPDANIASVKERGADLHRKVYGAMCERSRESNCSFIEYRPLP